MIITQPNDFVTEVHDRTPVLLQPDQFDRWLSGEMTDEELKPAADDYLKRRNGVQARQQLEGRQGRRDTRGAGEAGGVSGKTRQPRP
jgi:putative SOS response-associated peptidase YedK